MLPPMISYAQNAEDVVLRRVFFDRPVGFYVDIGACDPVEDNVTKHFYDRGWSGVNVEPDCRLHTALAVARPRDCNICAAVGRDETAVTFYPTKTRGHGTLESTLAADVEEAVPETVPQITLARIFAERVPPAGVDFLKVDVEGWEFEVLSSADWSKIRPRVVLVEAVDRRGQPSHARWEGILFDVGYRFGLFDGLNRFYCRPEDAKILLPRMAAPGNVLDNWRFAREVRGQSEVANSYQSELDRMSNKLAEQNGTLTAQSAALLAEHTAHAMTRSALNAEQVAHGATRDALRNEHEAHLAALNAISLGNADLQAEQAAHEVTREALEREHAAHRMTHGALKAELYTLGDAVAERDRLIAAMYASTSWRLTTPLRNVRHLARLLKPGG